MAECNSIEVRNIYLNLNAQQQFRLNKISEIRDYIIAEIREKKLMSERLSKYIASFNYFDKSIIVLSYLVAVPLHYLQRLLEHL